jgi:hypothetical protein
MSEKTTTRRLGVLGLLTVVAMIVMAVGASAAFAGGLSEFKGNTTKNTFHGVGGLATFTSEKGTTVMCNTSLSTGEVTSAQSAKLVVTYSGNCKLANAPIGNGACESPIKTEELKATPIVIAGMLSSNRGLLILPASGSEIAKFKCGSVSVKVKGGVICEDEPNTGKPGTKGKVTCAQGTKNGEQLYTSGESVDKTVSTSLTAEATDIFTLTEKDSQATEEAVTYLESIEQT